MSFKLTTKQQEAGLILASPATHIMLAGGSRSAKTFTLLRAIVIRALRAKRSRHGVFRFRFGHVKQSVIYDTFPKVMELAFPDVKYELNKSDWFATLPGDSEIWFGGLDEKERTEKVLGQEYATVFLNEASQISYSARNTLLTRLAQLVYDQDGQPLPLREYVDENPPNKGHWTYKLFLLHQDPESKKPINPADYAFLQMNPGDNRENLNSAYLSELEKLPPRLRARFLEGKFGDLAPNALFSEDNFERYRVLENLPEMLRVVVAVDPSGSDDTDNADNDAIGMSVAGLGIDGNGYVMHDLTVKAGPATWGKVATDAFEREAADRIVGEDNFGGAMVKHVIQTARPHTPYRAVKASRGKTVRAEPIAALFETGKVRMVGYHQELEDELVGFTTHGYTGDHSPNSADAMIWALSDLFPELTRKEEEPKQIIQAPRSGPNDWMHM